MRTVSITTELPIPAEQACAMALQGPVFLHVVWPVLGLRRGAEPPVFDPAEPLRARLWLLFGLVPGWRHEIRVVEHTPTLIRTEERGGLLRTWNHELRFEPLEDEAAARDGAARCRYTDRVTIDAGLLTLPTAWFAHAFYRWRQRRWRHLIAPNP